MPFQYVKRRQKPSYPPGRRRLTTVLNILKIVISPLVKTLYEKINLVKKIFKGHYFYYVFYHIHATDIVVILTCHLVAANTKGSNFLSTPIALLPIQR